MGQPPVVEEVAARIGRQKGAEAVDGDGNDDQSQEGPADPIRGAESLACSRVQPGLRLSPLILPGARRTTGPPAGRSPSLLTVVRRRSIGRGYTLVNVGGPQETPQLHAEPQETVPDMAALDPPASGATILDLYRATWFALRQAIVRYRVAIAFEIGMIALWFVLRTVVDVGSGAYLAWTVIACAAALISPTTGLVILVATAPFFEPHSVTRALGMRDVLVGVLGIAVALRLVVGGWRQLPRSPALALGGLVAAITAVGVAHTARDFGPELGMHVSQEWLDTVGGAMILLMVGAWVARAGEARQLIVAAIACAVASVLSLIELAQPGAVSNGPFGWIGFWKDFGARVAGIIPAPNAVATMLLIPATATLAAIGHFHGRRRVAAVVVAVPLVAGAVLTLSRTAFGGLYLAAVVFIARRRRLVALVVLVIGLVLAAVSLPLFIEFRANRAGIFVTQSPLEWIVGADQARLDAWAAGVRMWLDSPIVGHGFLSYKTLADSFGDPRLGSPHNEVLRLFAEEGLIGGIIMIAFVGSVLRELARRRDWIGAGILAGAIGYWLGAMFNNPLLFIQVSAMAFVFVGYGLTAPVRKEPADATTPATD